MSNRPETTVTKNRMNNFIYITLFAVNVYNSSKTIQFYVHKKLKNMCPHLGQHSEEVKFSSPFWPFSLGTTYKTPLGSLAT
jgi:hypothetical protein